MLSCHVDGTRVVIFIPFRSRLLIALLSHIVHQTLNTWFYFHSRQLQNWFKFNALVKCKNSITVSKWLYSSHLHEFELFSEAEIGAAVLVIKAEETKQQISRLNNEVTRFCGGWSILTMIQGTLKKTQKTQEYDKCVVNVLIKLDEVPTCKAVWGFNSFWD